jgi:hypothetical protein
MLQSIPDDGLGLAAMGQGRIHRIGTQILTLRILVDLGLVVESEQDHDLRFTLTDAGKAMLRSETIEPSNQDNLDCIGRL